MSFSLPALNKNQLLYWLKTISITGFAQVIVQGVGFATGILIIRLLPTQEYALYTLANTMLGTMTVLSDGGISAGVMSQGGKVWQDKEKLGAVLATGLDMRRKFAILSLIVSIPILLYLLLHNGATWLKAILITLSLIPAFYAALSDSLLEIVPKLHQDIVPLQRNQITVGIGRLILSSISLFIFPWTAIALVANGIPRIYGNSKLAKIGHNFIDHKQLPDPDVKKEILGIVKRIMPGSIYYCVSGQISIWIISIFGQTNSVAELGALGRFSLIFTIISTLVSILLIPRFARVLANRKVLFQKFFQINSIVLLISILIICIISIFTDPLLWILGKNYSNLSFELILSIIAGSINLLAGVIFSLYTSRGWAIFPAISISISILSIILGAILFHISTLQGVLFYNIFLAFIQLSIGSVYTIIKIYRNE